MKEIFYFINCRRCSLTPLIHLCHPTIVFRRKSIAQGTIYCLNTIFSYIHWFNFPDAPSEDSPAMAHTALREIVERAVEEAKKLPSLGGSPSETGKPQERKNITDHSYEDLLATAILNKVTNHNTFNRGFCTRCWGFRYLSKRFQISFYKVAQKSPRNTLCSLASFIETRCPRGWGNRWRNSRHRVSAEDKSMSERAGFSRSSRNSKRSRWTVIATFFARNRCRRASARWVSVPFCTDNCDLGDRASRVKAIIFPLSFLQVKTKRASTRASKKDAAAWSLCPRTNAAASAARSAPGILETNRSRYPSRWVTLLRRSPFSRCCAAQSWPNFIRITN